VAERFPEGDIVDYALENRGFTYLKDDGLLKCVEGVTTLEEVLRVAG